MFCIGISVKGNGLEQLYTVNISYLITKSHL